jgi:NADH-ubiquinone oxidoreductase chain 5
MVDITNNSLGRKIYTFFNGKYYFDIIYNQYFISSGLHLGYTISKFLDRGILEIVGPYGLTNSVYNTANNISRLDTGIITTYATYIALGLIAFLAIIFSSLIVNIDPRIFIISFLYFTFVLGIV